MCYHPNPRKTRYRCVYSKQYYVHDPEIAKDEYFTGEVCSNDPHFYEACDKGIGGRITNNKLLCEHYLCRSRFFGIFTPLELDEFYHNACDVECINTKFNKEVCNQDLITLPTGRKARSNEICDGKCDIVRCQNAIQCQQQATQCEDEGTCNGYRYGLYCKYRNRILDYVPPRRICDGHEYCVNGEDKKNCTVTESFCRHIRTGKLVPIHNFTRCVGVDKISYNRDNRQYCQYSDMVKQHTNCSDPSRVGITCEINGYKSTVSKYLICFDDTISACDDKIESKCLTTRSCRIHKHFMCDDINDCEDKADEINFDCMSITRVTCKRRLGRKIELPIPISWLNDGVEDCENGQDETGKESSHESSKGVKYVSFFILGQEILVSFCWTNFVMVLKPVEMKIRYVQSQTVLKAWQYLFVQQIKVSPKFYLIANQVCPIWSY